MINSIKTSLHFAGILIFVFLLFSLLPAQAIDVASIQAASVTDLSPDCSNIIVELSMTRTGTSSDGIVNGNPVDFYYAVVYDGYGNPHYADDLAVVFPSSGTVTPQIDGTLLGVFTALPARVVIYDVISGGIRPLHEATEYPAVASVTFDPGLFAPNCLNLPFVEDQRINSLEIEPWQTVAIYCRVNGAIDIYQINEFSEGYLVIHATQSEIDTVGVPSVNTLIESSSDGAVRLYRLSTGEYQVIAPRDHLFDGYVFIWDENDCV